MEDFGIADVVFAGAFIEEIKEPFDGRRQVLVHGEDGAEEVDDEFLDGSFGGEQAREEDFRNGFGRPIHLRRGRVLLAVGFAVVHRRAHQVDRLQVIPVFRIAAVLKDRLAQSRAVVIRVHACQTTTIIVNGSSSIQHHQIYNNIIYE